MKRIKHLMTVLFFSLFSCNMGEDEVSDLLIERDTMVELLAEQHIFQSFAKLRSDRNQKGFSLDSAYEWMLEHHHVTDTAFRYSINYYASDQVLFESIYDDVLVRIAERQEEIGK